MTKEERQQRFVIFLLGLVPKKYYKENVLDIVDMQHKKFTDYVEQHMKEDFGLDIEFNKKMRGGK